jgi:hypothetical protein
VRWLDPIRASEPRTADCDEERQRPVPDEADHDCETPADENPFGARIVEAVDLTFEVGNEVLVIRQQQDGRGQRF